MKRNKTYNLFTIVLDTVKIAPLSFAIEYIATVADGVALALIAMLTGRLFQAAMQYSKDIVEFSVILTAVLSLITLYVVSELASGISNYFGEVYCDLSIQYFMSCVQAKVIEFSAESFESSDQLDRINGAYNGAVSARQVVNVLMDILTLYIPYFVIYGIYLYTVSPLLMVIFPLIVVPTVLAQLIKANVSVGVEEESAIIRRRKDAYNSYIGEREFMKETRILGATDYFLKGLKQTCGRLAKVTVFAKTKSWIIDMAVNLIQTLGYGGIVYLLIASVFEGKISITDFAAIFSTSSILIDLVKELFADRLSELTEKYGLVKRYIDFMNIPQKVYDRQEMHELTQIEVEHISFRYPLELENVYAIHDVSFKLKKGESLALVGENGSGKTTLTKVLLGLYEPTEGKVLYNDISGKEINAKCIWKNSTAVFQKFGKYDLSVGENVALDDVSSVADVEKAVKQAKVDMLTNNYTMNTLLSKEFGGVELSGGQWQKMAIARGIYHIGDFVVLDEPTAAIDPVNEQLLYGSFMQMLKGRIGVVVTHRLGLARCCTHIALMKNGQIIDMGTHEELLQSSEYYRLLWQAQADSYRF